ncbi:MAG: methyltransferase domain-containing protein [Deltaproteobacteria bacterium]|nr:methyltransferase domain-containing protein [Deltaproteobacteria bacterium]
MKSTQENVPKGSFDPNQVAATNTAHNDVDGRQSARWANEVEFFDRLADRIERGLRPFSSKELNRYTRHPRRIYDKEFRFRMLGDLTGLRVLDLGCGEGSNSVFLALNGAQVVGLDISPRLIELAKKRAGLNGVESKTQFRCIPIERAELPESSFDVIWGDGILHHLIDVLEPTLQQLVRCAKPGARIVFSEPVAQNLLLRSLRGHVPIHTDATPDERPLETRELELINKYLPGLRAQHFHGLGRLTQFVVPVHAYEEAPWHRRLLADALHTADFAMLSVPGLRSLGGMRVMWGEVRK